MPRPKLLNSLQALWNAGLKTQSIESVITVQLTPTVLFLPRSNRWKFTICNMSGGNIQIASQNGMSANGGIILTALETLSMVAIDDGDTVTYGFEAQALVATASVYLREEFLVESNVE